MTDIVQIGSVRSISLLYHITSIYFNLGNITYTEMDIYSTIISTRTTISLNAIPSSIFRSFRKTPLSLLFKTVLSCFWMSAGLFHGGVHERGESTTKYNFKMSVY